MSLKCLKRYLLGICRKYICIFPRRLIILYTDVSCRFAQFGKFSIKQDVYAFGVILFQMVSGKEAITDHPDEDTDEKIQLVLLVTDLS